MSIWSMAVAGDSAQAAGDARAAGRAAGDLEVRLERTLLVCQAMWTLLRDKLSMSDMDLLNRINDLDLSDGRLDGKVRTTGHKCPSCGRVIGPRFANCMYCGQAVQHNPFA